MQRWHGKVAVVTGASAGIGAAIVTKLTESGVTVVGLARRKDRLDELDKQLYGKKGKFYGHVTDISKEQDTVKAFRWINENVGPLGILVNNAGINRNTTLSDGEVKLWKDIIDTNFLGLCIATREAVRYMKADGIDGHIVHINSIAGHKVINYPLFNVYPATKFAVTALAETLRHELIETNSKIKVSSVSPGAVKTEIMETANKASDIKRPPKSQIIKNFPILAPEDVAEGVIYVLSTPPHVQVQELIIKPIGENL